MTQLPALSDKQSFMLFLALQLIVWTALPSFFFTNYPIDILEGLAWGQEYQWGYWKHPPLTFVLMYKIFDEFSRITPIPYLLSQVSVIGTMFILYRLGRALSFKPAGAISAALSLQLLYFFNFTSVEFNPNVLLLPLWAMSIFSTYKALHQEKRHYFILLGVCAALGCMTKYFMGTLLLTIALYILWFETTHQRWKKDWWAVLLGASAFLLLMTPHIIWFFDTPSSPLSYAMSRAHLGQELTLQTYIIHVLQFFISEFWIISFFILAMVLLRHHYVWFDKKMPITDDYLFVVAMGLGPLLLSFLWVLGTGTHFRTMWSSPLWLLLPLFILYPSKAVKHGSFFKPFRSFIYCFWALIIVIFITMNIAANYSSLFHLRTQFPGKELVSNLEEKWHSHSMNTSPYYVMGPMTLAANFAAYSTSTPHIVILDHWTENPWASEELIKKHGALVVWDEERPWFFEPEFVRTFPDLLIQPSFPLSWKNEQMTMNVTYGFIPPAKEDASSSK